jgi:hypothetical protein
LRNSGVITVTDIQTDKNLAEPFTKGLSLRQKGLAVTGVFSRTLTIEASIADLQPLIMCTTDGQSCISLGGDARIKFVLLAVLLDLMSDARQRYSSDSQTMCGTSVMVLI